MSVIVVKGQKIDLTKTNPELNSVFVELGWQSPAVIELDASAFLLGTNGKVANDQDLVFYGNHNGGRGTVTYLTGAPGSRKIKLL